MVMNIKFKFKWFSSTGENRLCFVSITSKHDRRLFHLLLPSVRGEVVGYRLFCGREAIEPLLPPHVKQIGPPIGGLPHPLRRFQSRISSPRRRPSLLRTSRRSYHGTSSPGLGRQPSTRPGPHGTHGKPKGGGQAARPPHNETDPALNLGGRARFGATGDSDLIPDRVPGVRGG